MTILRRCVAPLLVAMVLTAMSAPAMAQSGAPRPPEPKQIEDAPLLKTYFMLVVMAALVIGANTIPSKRGHQD